METLPLAGPHWVGAGGGVVGVVSMAPCCIAAVQGLGKSTVGRRRWEGRGGEGRGGEGMGGSGGEGRKGYEWSMKKRIGGRDEGDRGKMRGKYGQGGGNTEVECERGGRREKVGEDIREKVG